MDHETIGEVRNKGIETEPFHQRAGAIVILRDKAPGTAVAYTQTTAAIDDADVLGVFSSLSGKGYEKQSTNGTLAVFSDGNAVIHKKEFKAIVN